MRVGSVSKKRTCPRCGGRKDFDAAMCRTCRTANGLWISPTLGRFGSNHPSWKGGQIVDRYDYIKTYAPDHPWPRKGGYVFEHVRLMELHLGRRPLPTENVHHRDGNRQNNSFSNLEVCDRAEHARHHRLQDFHLRTRDSQGRFV